MILSDVCTVCLSRTSSLSREQRGLGRPKFVQSLPTSHVTWIPLSRSKGQRSRSPGRFTQRGLNAYGGCSGQRMGTYSAWESTATLRLLGGVRRREERGGAYCVATRTACYMYTQYKNYTSSIQYVRPRL